MKKLVYLIVVIVALGLIVVGCFPVVPPTGQDELGTLPTKSLGTIQAAIDAASPGDTIYVASGTYNENVNINKSLTLQGENRETTVIEGSGYTSLPTLTISADEVTVSGFTIHSESTKEPVWTIWVEGDSVLLTDLHVIKDPDKWVSGATIYLTPGLNGFTFTDSIVDSVWNGIYAPRNPGSINIVVQNVDFTYPGEYAILLLMVTGATIEDNTFACTADYYGVIVTRGNDGIKIADNEFIGSGSLADSHIGILFNAYAEGTMGDVTILDNDISGFNTGILVQDVATFGISINYNNISGNAYGVNYLGSDTVDATRNWWGHPGGPLRLNPDNEWAGPRTADRVSRNVDYHPWLHKPVDN